ncbi:hypothetical protein CCP2SC5_1590002 [Azospirillaceae bacterium]
MQQLTGTIITREFNSVPVLHRMAAPVSGQAYWDYPSADAVALGVIVGFDQNSAAPYMAQIQINSVVQIESDGSGAIAAGDPIAAAASGKAKKRAKADGTTTRNWIGYAHNAAAATAGLLVDVQIAVHSASNT